MAQTTTNYGLLKPEATDSYNHLIFDNPNMDTIDAALKANSDAAITAATCIKSGTTHTITRVNSDANVMKFTATGDWNTGDTMIIDGVTVSPYLVTGEALKTGAFLINTEVLVALSGVRATVYSNQSEAGSTLFDDTNVPFTTSNVQGAIDGIQGEINVLLNSTSETDSDGNVYINVGSIVCVVLNSLSNLSFTAWENKKIGTIPAGKRPATNIYFVVPLQNAGNNERNIYGQLAANGDLNLVNQSNNAVTITMLKNSFTYMP